MYTTGQLLNKRYYIMQQKMCQTHVSKFHAKKTSVQTPVNRVYGQTICFPIQCPWIHYNSIQGILCILSPI